MSCRVRLSLASISSSSWCSWGTHSLVSLSHSTLHRLCLHMDDCVVALDPLFGCRPACSACEVQNLKVCCISCGCYWLQQLRLQPGLVASKGQQRSAHLLGGVRLLLHTQGLHLGLQVPLEVAQLVAQGEGVPGGRGREVLHQAVLSAVFCAGSHVCRSSAQHAYTTNQLQPERIVMQQWCKAVM